MVGTVYVTGCLGFIGSEFTELLLDNRYRVIGVDALTYAANKSKLLKFETSWKWNRTGYGGFKFIGERIENLAYLHEEPEFIVNFAAETHVDNSIGNSSLFMKSNIDGVRNLLELTRLARGRKPTLIHISTDEVYGDIQHGKHLETDILKPSNPYSATKAAADMLIVAWARTYGIDYNIIRPTNNYGFGQNSEKLIPSAIECLRQGRRIKLHNQGTPVRTWLNVADTATAVHTVMTKGKRGEIYNISGDKECTNNETVRLIFDAYKKRPITPNSFIGFDSFEQAVDYSYNRPGQDVRYAVDDTKLRELGWTPKMVFEQQVEEIVRTSL